MTKAQKKLPKNGNIKMKTEDLNNKYYNSIYCFKSLKHKG